MQQAESHPVAARFRHPQVRTTGVGRRALEAVVAFLRTFLPPAPFWRFAERRDPALRRVKIFVLQVAAVHSPHHRVGLANPRQDRNDGAEAKESYQERQECNNAKGHQRGPEARQNDYLPITTQKLLGPAQRGPHDCLFWFFHSYLQKGREGLERSSSPRGSFTVVYPRTTTWTGWRMAISA